MVLQKIDTVVPDSEEEEMAVLVKNQDGEE